MRTTVTLGEDVAAAHTRASVVQGAEPVERLRRERSLGLSEAVNELVRAGLRAKGERRRFEQRSARLGLKVDVTNVAEALEQLEGPSAR